MVKMMVKIVELVWYRYSSYSESATFVLSVASGGGALVVVVVASDL